jgi:hypothetical protein
MRRSVIAACLFLLLGTFLYSQEKKVSPGEKTAAENRGAAEDRSSGESAEKLPVRRVVLYKNGVGYFEHLGHVRGSQDVHIDFTSAQLNDVLKSLTVLDLDGGRISGVDYNSEASHGFGVFRSVAWGASGGSQRCGTGFNGKTTECRTENQKRHELDGGDGRDFAH